MKKIYALAAAAFMAVAANAQNGAPLYITGAGDFTNGTWAAATPDEFAYENGVYTITVDNLTQFKISTVCDPESGNGGWDGFNGGAIGVPGYDKSMLDTPVALVPTEDNTATPWKGNYTLVVAGDLSTLTMSTDTPEPTDTSIHLFLRGDMNGWGAPEEWELTQLDGSMVFQFTCADDQVVAIGEAFKIADADWNVYNVGGDGEPMILDVETTVFNGGNPANITLEEEWNGVVFLNLTDLENCAIYFSNDKNCENPFSIGGAVEGVTVDSNAAPVYFNLQGVKLATPESGINIVVKDGKATKVLVK